MCTFVDNSVILHFLVNTLWSLYGFKDLLLYKLSNVGQHFKKHFTVLFVLILTYSLFIILELSKVTLLSSEVSTAVWLRIPVFLGCDAASLDKWCVMFWRNTRNNLPSLGASCPRGTESTITLGIQYTTCLYPSSCCVLHSDLRNLLWGDPLYINLRNFFFEQWKHMRTALFWVITLWALLISYQHFGTTYQSHLQGSGIPRDR